MVIVTIGYRQLKWCFKMCIASIPLSLLMSPIQSYPIWEREREML